MSDEFFDFVPSVDTGLSLDAPPLQRVGSVADPIQQSAEPVAPEERASKFRDFVLRAGGGRPSLLNALSAAFGQGTEEIAARRRAKLEEQVFEKQAQDILTAQPARLFEEDVGGRKRFLDTGELIFPDVEAPVEAPEFSNLQEAADGSQFGLNKSTGKIEFIESPFGPEKPSPLTQKQFDNTNKLIANAKRDKRVDDFIKVSSSFDRVGSASPNAAGDLALVFSFMKMLDPGSVVREGEQALARNAAGVPERIRTTYNNILEGETLSPKQRDQFKGEARRVLDASRLQAQKAVDPIKTQASRFNIRPESIQEAVFGLPQETSADVTPQFTEGQTATGSNGEKIIFRNGQWQTL